jgi:hypothetical protein
MKNHSKHQKEYFKIHLSYLFFLGLILLSACGGKSIEPTIIPSEASIVVSIDFNSMSSKAAEWKDLFNPELLKSADLDDEEADVIAKLIGSGVDLTKPAYIFIKADKDEKKNYVGLTMGIKDAKKFEDGLKKLDETPKITKKGSRQYAIKDNTVISWNASSMLMTSLQEGENQKEIEAIHENVLKTTSSNSLESKNKDFKAFLSKTYDIGVWMDYAKISAISNSADMLELPPNIQDMSKLTESIKFLVNFNKGEVILDAESKLNAEMMKKYQDLFKGNMNDNLVKATPVKSPMMLFGVGIGMKGLRKLLEEAGYLEDAKQTADMIGISVDEIFEMLSGDMVLALESLNVENIFQPEIQGSVGLGISNKKTLEKIFIKFEGMLLKKKDKYYVLRAGDVGQYFLIEKDDMLILTTNETLRDNAIKGSNGLDSKVASMANNKLSVMYVDFQKVIKSLPKGTINDPIVEKEVLPKFISMEATSDNYKGSSSKGQMVIKMSEKDRNALAIIVEMIKKTSKKKEKVGA